MAQTKEDILSQLAIMGYADNYITRAMKIHQKSKFGDEYNLSLLVEIIDRLKQKDKTKKQNGKTSSRPPVKADRNSVPPVAFGGGLGGLPPPNEPLSPPIDTFRAHFASAQEALDYIQTHNGIDYRFDNGRYILCKIIQKSLSSQQPRITLHPASQPLTMTKHNKECYIYDEFHKLAVEKSVSLRRIKSNEHPLVNVKIDDYVDVNPRYKAGHQGWKHGQVIKIDATSAQVKVLYYANQENHSYWIHLEDEMEAAAFNSKYDPLKHQIMGNFSEYTDNTALKRFTSIDVIESQDTNVQSSANKKAKNKQDAIEQLLKFGYTRKQVLLAMDNVNDKLDMNQLIEAMESKEVKQSGNKLASNPFMQQSKKKNSKQAAKPAPKNTYNTNKKNGVIDRDFIIDDEKNREEMNAYSLQQANKGGGLLSASMNKRDDFDNQLSSLAFGNELVMDDIIAQMEDGDDGQNEDDVDNPHETPMGPTPAGPNGDEHGGQEYDEEYEYYYEDEEEEDYKADPGGGGGVHDNNPLMADTAQNQPIPISPNTHHQNGVMSSVSPLSHPTSPSLSAISNHEYNGGPISPISSPSAKKGKSWKNLVSSPKEKKKKGGFFGGGGKDKKKKEKEKKKDKKKMKNKGPKKKLVFGVDVRTLSCTKLQEYASPIPDVLIKLKSELFKHNGHSIEGVFRIAPNGDESKSVEEEIDCGNLHSINFGIIGGDVLSNLIKLWFRNLPTPLLQEIVMNNRMSAVAEDANMVAACIEMEVSEPQRSLFLWLLDLCCDVVQHEAINRMGIRAMSVVIAPNMYDPSKLANPMLAMTLSDTAIKFMERAIEWRQVHTNRK